jgi:hypothetical protein
MDNRETLQKQTRIVENDTQKYQQAVKQQLQKQSDAIVALKKENEKLKSDVATSAGGSYKFAEQDATSQLQADIETLERKLNFEKMRQRDLDKKLAVARMDLSRARKSMNGVNVTQDNITLIDKQVRVLENRLDQALVQFNESLAYNRDLRREIDNLRGERKVFTEIYRKLESDLHDKKKKMADIIERSNKDYEERDAYNAQLEQLRSKAKEEAAQSDEHFAKLDDLMIKYKHLKDQHQQQALQQQQQQQQQSHKSPLKPKAETDRKDDRDATRKKNLNATEGKLSLPDDASNPPDEEDNVEAAIEDLKERTERPMDKLLAEYIQNEEQSFSLYNFVNELKTQKEKLEGEIAVLEEQDRRQRGDSQRTAALKALENELAVTETQHEALASRTNTTREALKNISEHAQDVFNKIQCSKVMAEELAGTTEVNEINLLTFLGIIEHRANELLFAKNIRDTNSKKKEAAGKDEEARRRRAEREARRQARADAGENVDDEDEYDEDEDVSPAGEVTRARFVGIGPSTKPGANTAARLVKFHEPNGMPSTAATDATGGDGRDDIDEDTIVDHDALRMKMETELRKRREKESSSKNKPRKK